ncbi:MAG: hypothetical protein KGK34_13185, partial [Chloroflexota bacterium]|nr:hypothetical protein [Chloroflexota bacterium]
AQTQSGTLASLVGAPLALVGGAGAIAIAVVASLIGDPELRSFGGEAASGVPAAETASEAAAGETVI